MTLEKAIKNLNDNKNHLEMYKNFIESRELFNDVAKAMAENERNQIKAIEMAIAAIKAQRWIPVSERLPDKQKAVIIAVADPSRNYVETGWLNNLTWYDCDGNKANYVTHWMPLPKFPKEVE